ncbi:MAG: YceI family protein [Gemmatimonadota bacterium]
MTAAAVVPVTTSWKLDATHSVVEFSARHMMFTTVKGRFARVEGTVIAGESPALSSVNVTIDANSIDTRVEQRDQHLRSADFLDVAQFPTITFQSTRLEGIKSEFRMTGDLTIHGVTRPVTLDVTYEGSGTDPWGNERIGFTAAGKIDRREFGLVWNQALEAGGVLVSNDVKIQIEVQLVKA